MYKTQGK